MVYVALLSGGSGFDSQSDMMHLCVSSVCMIMNSKSQLSQKETADYPQ